MHEPAPTPAEQWSAWEMEPVVPDDWPGLDESRFEGFEISRGPVKSTGSKLVALAAEAGDIRYNGTDGVAVAGMNWDLPRELQRLMVRADEAVAGFWNDVYAETGMAGMLIERAAANYRLADEPKLGDVPLERLQERVGELGPARLREPSDLYPNGSMSLHLPKEAYYGVDHMTAEKAKRDIETLVLYGGYRDPESYRQMAESLAGLAPALRLRAQDLYDSPWRGEAAVRAQWALRQLHGNVTALAAVTGALYRAGSRFLEVITWCARYFEAMADPDRSGWDEFWDFGGTPDSRTRDFLAQVNTAFMQVYEMLPKRIAENLPGLLVDDQNLAEIKREVGNWYEHRRARPLTGEPDLIGPLLSTRKEGYIRAEEYYG